VLATNLAGSRRVTAGAARDHFLGFEAVSGLGERFKAGGKVVKNVTGYDLPKLVAGSWGTLAVMTEVTIRVAPAPETERTLIVESEKPERAVELMTLALGSSCDVSSAAFDPREGVAIRLEGFTASVDARMQALRTLVNGSVAAELAPVESRAFWARHGGAHALADWPFVWRISVPPSHAPRVLASLAAERYLLDWGGGLIWAAYGQLDVAGVRSALREGHATLIKAPAAARRETCSFPPPSASLAVVQERIKRAFDPDNRLNPGRLD
jgi:glycolate oxidase FAD binding subunit